MYKLKEKPEDFIVKEIPNFEIMEKGRYPIFLLKKINYTTENAIKKIADYFHIKPKFIGYAGIKDKKAVTEQYISINILKKRFSSIKLSDIELNFLGYNDEPVYLGRLKGNSFKIKVRNLKEPNIDKLRIKSEMLIPNLFGEQRFSKNNANIGKLIIMKEFEKATKEIVKLKGNSEKLVDEHLKKHPHDYIGAIRKIQLKIRKLYIHSYQSELFNRAALTYIEQTNSKKNLELLIIGFGTEFKNKLIKEIYEKIMYEEGITLRDFIIKGMQELSSTGFTRNLYIKVNDFKIINIEKDELNEGKKKVIVMFSLPKGCYATVVIDYLLRK